MKRIWKPLLLASIAGILAYSLYAQVNARGNESSNVQDGRPVGTKVGDLAPDFTGTTLEGETIRLSDFQGKVVVINAFASWCGPCLVETPHLVEVSEAERGEVVIIGLNQIESESRVADYRDEFDVPYPLVLNPDGKLTELYLPVGLPTSWFIDQDGVIRYVHAGPMTTAMLQEALDAVREGREPDVFALVNQNQ
jgi:peroxiredoxin